MITVADLKDQLGTKYPRPVLYCRVCGAECSAHKGDYFMLPDTHVFKCCRRNMILATVGTAITIMKE